MRLWAAVIALLVGQSLVASAVLAAPATGPADANTLVFFHWLTSPSESAALKALIDVFRAKHPDVTLKPTVAPDRGSVSLFPLIRRSVAAGRPPEAFLMHAGYSTQPFYEAGLLNPVDGIWESEKLEKVVPVVLQGMNKLDGHYYSIPLNVHRNNLVWYNKALLERHKVDPASLTTWEAFFEAARKLRAAGIRSPIQMAGTWTAVHAFEGIMASQGIGAYQDWVNGRIRTPDDPRVLRALVIFKEYLGYVNPDHAALDWELALKRVIQGESAFCAMGDWADGEFHYGNLQFGKDYGAFVVPGTQGMYGVTLDAFVQPRGLARAESSNQWLRVAASREGQDAFNSRKGSIPARTDADPAKYDDYQKAAIADFKSAKSMYPTVGAGTPEAFKIRLENAVGAFCVDTDIDRAARALVSATSDLESKYTRVWALK